MGTASASTEDATLQSLFERANYWHAKSRNDIALEVLKKVLLVEPHHPQALYLMALWHQQTGDLEAARQWEERLARVAPGDPRLTALAEMKQMASLPQAQVARARQYAQTGDVDAALTVWRTLFNGDVPPPGLAVEYYMTMAGDERYYATAREALERFARQYPHNDKARIAIAKLMTWRQETRREGIGQLSEMAERSSEADEALRQGLLWLSPSPDDVVWYDEWLSRHPDDKEVENHLSKHRQASYKTAAYDALNEGDTEAAKRHFQEVLSQAPDDPEALAGLGYAAMKGGQFKDAAAYLKRAAAQGGEGSQDLQRLSDDAAFFSRLAQAQQLLSQGKPDEALVETTPLLAEEGEKGIAAQLFYADLLRRKKQYDDAQAMLYEILDAHPQHAAASESLFYLLLEQQKTDDAQALVSTLPDALQKKLRRITQPSNDTRDIRQRADTLAKSDDPNGAIALLREGIQRFPDDPWLRLDLARLLSRHGKASEAADVFAVAFQPQASPDMRYAAALYCGEKEAWQAAQKLLEGIPEKDRSTAARELAQRVAFQMKLDAAERYLDRGKAAAARNTLRALIPLAPSDAVDVGRLANMLVQSGDRQSAVQVVRDNLKHGIHGNAGDYSHHILVLSENGYQHEAQTLLENPELQRKSDPEQQATLRALVVVKEADALRERDNLGAAWDLLVREMRNEPEDTSLMLAMARVYQSGHKPAEAGTIYRRILDKEPDNQEALTGMVNVALSQNQPENAQMWAERLKADRTPERLMLLARVEKAQQRNVQAKRYLRQARGALLGHRDPGSEMLPTVNGVALADNPFRSAYPSQNVQEKRKRILPWQAAGGASLAGSPESEDIEKETLLNQIDSMMRDVDDVIGTWAQNRVEVRVRDGEAGNSSLTDVSSRLSWQSALTDRLRMIFSATPVSLNAGSASGDAWRRHGSHALANATSNLLTTIRNEKQRLAAMDSAQREAWFAANPGAETLAGLTLPDTVNSNLTQPEMQAYLAKLKQLDGGQVARYLASSSLKNNVNDAGSMLTDSHKADGVELAFAFGGPDYLFDIGTTTAGLKQSDVVGGLSWQPKLGNQLSLDVKAERRAVTDSLLSWSGLTDSYSGETWGGVTKNGIAAQLNYDKGDAGMYIGAGAYRYLGENVASNSSLALNTGVYFRPLKAADETLQTGMNLGWMSYKRNLSHFTFGQGGYFSPQRYFSVSLPVDYSHRFDRWQIALGGSAGFQSWTQDPSDYFPTRPQWQSILQDAADAGFAKEARYEGSSKNGIGYSFRAGADYYLNNAMRIGGELGYDTFGDYNESSASLWLRYTPGGQ